MVGKTRKIRLISLLLAAVMLLSVSAFAAPATDVTDAKDDIASVDITQIYNGKEKDSAVHNYDTDGDEVNITYEATLYMTEEMAMYLNAPQRQPQLMDAKFNIHVDMDLDLVEFTEKGGTLTVTFSSSFLKPWDVKESDVRKYPDAFDNYQVGAYASELVKVEDGIFYYEISIDKASALENAAKYGCIDIPMELIVYYDGKTAYGFDDVPSTAYDEQAMFYNFTVEDWMKEIHIETASVRVKDEVRESVTYDPGTWKTVTAKGTVDGEFTYEKAETIRTIGDYQRAFNTETLEFGNDFATDGEVIEEWTSNVVQVKLVRQNGLLFLSPYLNLEDHFAYVIGYPDGKVHPEGNITRAEVATIFFRMLTDEVRDQYWATTNPYNDVSKTDWFNNAVSTLTNLGVIDGYPDGGFHPNANITRAEFATIAVRFFEVSDDYTWTTDAFSDLTGHWANAYINLAHMLGIVDGYPDGTFRPQKNITRAEAMTIVNNTLRREPVKEGLLPVSVMITWPDNKPTDWYYAEVQEATNSHTYHYGDNINGEIWLEELPVRDWAAFEKAWSDANAAANPGEVTD